MPGKSPGPSIHNPATYEALKKKGLSKASAAAISNAALNKGYARGVHRKKKRTEDDDDALDGASIEWLVRRGYAMTTDKEFSTEKRRRLAKSGKAMPGGGFPIESSEDLKNAIRAFGRAKNPAAAKSHIKQRARALGLTKLIPENWDSARAAKQFFPTLNDSRLEDIFDLWTAIEDGSVCPDCRGDGLDEEGDMCETCGGDGYVGLPANLERDAAPKKKKPDDDDDDDVDDCGPGWRRKKGSMDSMQLTETFVLDGGVRKTKAGYRSQRASLHWHRALHRG
jgi:hypothetical protein